MDCKGNTAPAFRVPFIVVTRQVAAFDDVTESLAQQTKRYRARVNDLKNPMRIQVSKNCN